MRKNTEWLSYPFVSLTIFILMLLPLVACFTGCTETPDPGSPTDQSDPPDIESFFSDPNGKYRDVDRDDLYHHVENCQVCHDVRAGFNNLALIADVIPTPNSGDQPVVFTQIEGDNSFADGNDTYNGVCEVCHTATSYHRNSTEGLHDHYAGQNCTTVCHPHSEEFFPNCHTCHGNPPVVDTPQGQDGLVDSPEPTGSITAGAHNLHVNTYSLSCDRCHSGGMPISPVTGDFRLQIGFDILGFSGAGTIYNQQVLNGSYSYQGTNGTTIENGAPTTCGNVYCHSDGTAVSTSWDQQETYTGPNQVSPAWDGETACDSCHQYPPVYAEWDPKANAHLFHVGLFSTPGTNNYDEFPCQACHLSTTSDGITIDNPANHANRQYEVVPDPGTTFHITDSISSPIDFTYSYDPGGGTCSNISCHLDFGWNPTMAWGYVNIDAAYSAGQGDVCGEITLDLTVTTGSALPPFKWWIDWDSDDQWDYIGYESSHTHLYDNTDAQIITYSVRDARGRTLQGDGTKVTGTIWPYSGNSLPVVAVEASTNGLTVTLTDLSYDLDYNLCGHTGSGRVILDWGPGGFVQHDFDPPLNDLPSGQMFSFTYPDPGTYYIQYGVYDNHITYPVWHDNIPVTVTGK